MTAAVRDERALPGHAEGSVVCRFDGRAMASGLSLTAVMDGSPAGRGRAGTAWTVTLDEFAAAEAALSRFRDTSEVTRLDRAALSGRAMHVSPRLRRAVVACDRARRVTEGRFDPRVIGQLDAWGYPGAALPDEAPMDHLGAPERIVAGLEGSRVRLHRPLDLGGIGKGLAVRWAADRVRSLGIDRFLLDAGGDIAARGASPEGGPWMVGIEDPAGGEDALAVVGLEDGAIATSSVRRGRWEADGRPRHHLVDPATGEPADGDLLAVTVALPDPAWAEIWSKSLFVAGRRSIGDLARAHGLAAWWVATDGTLSMTPAARVRTVWVAGEG
jgi:thiamine biosynthesis lipoprotein